MSETLHDKLAAIKLRLAVRPVEVEEHSAGKPIYTLDIETDPFLHGRFPQPFCVGVYDGDRFTSFWGANCINLVFEFLWNLPPGVIYAHNGGRFDILYFLKFCLEAKTLIINRRIVSVEMLCGSGVHDFRDSLAIFPFPLAAYQKEQIDYRKLEANVREENREEILHYLRADCVYLHELVIAFVKRFGLKLTIGATAMGEIKNLHEFQCLSKEQDFEIRGGRDGNGVEQPGFFYGGRVQYFKQGIIEGPVNIYDVNSMYPYVMKSFKHPLSIPGWDSKTPSIHTCFVVAEGKNYGAFPVRTKQGITFDVEDGTFFVSIHEWRIAIEHGWFKPKRIIRCINYGERGNFAKFVDTFYELRQQAKQAGDKIHELMYKYVLNSGYGKFAQNPLLYKEYTISDASIDLRETGWIPAGIEQGDFDTKSGSYIIWEKPTDDKARFNVATAASITGAARSVLLDALAKAEDPLYCDTDSIICKSLSSVMFSDTTLGAWKHEGTGTRAAIAGKKLYAIFDAGNECIKMASKGVSVTPQQIVEVAEGGTVESIRDAPTLGLDGSYKFITRKVRMT